MTLQTGTQVASQPSEHLRVLTSSPGNVCLCLCFCFCFCFFYLLSSIFYLLSIPHCHSNFAVPMPTRTCLQTENAKLYEHRQKPSNVKCSGHLPEALMQDRPRQLTSNSCIYRSVAQVPGYENKYLGGSGGTHEIPPRAPMLLPTPAFQFPTSVFPRPVVPQIT